MSKIEHKESPEKGVWLKFIRTPVFWGPLSFFLILEGCMQLGLYKPFLSPSYAHNVNRIVNVMEQTSVKPEAVILGTSVAYQGILTPELNKELKKYNGAPTVQNAATEGAMLETQHAIFNRIIDNLPDVRTVIHIAEWNFAWTARYELETANRSMLSQLPRLQVLPLLDEYKVRLNPDDYTYFFIKSVTYKSDMRDFILDPLDRVKYIGRRLREKEQNYVYVNQHKYALSVYGRTLNQCIENATKDTPMPVDENGNPLSDKLHRRTAIQTCHIAKHNLRNIGGAPQWNHLFFERLKLFHNSMRERNIKVFTVFAPYAEMLPDHGDDTPLYLWQDMLGRIYGDENYELIDLRYMLDGPDNADYFYDVIHLNESGARRFTHELGNRLVQTEGFLKP